MAVLAGCQSALLLHKYDAGLPLKPGRHDAVQVELTVVDAHVAEAEAGKGGCAGHDSAAG